MIWKPNTEDVFLLGAQTKEYIPQNKCCNTVGTSRLGNEPDEPARVRLGD